MSGSVTGTPSPKDVQAMTDEEYAAELASVGFVPRTENGLTYFVRRALPISELKRRLDEVNIRREDMAPPD